jgi:hypothetical protein
MGQQDRAALYNALKAHGWEPEHRYSGYSEDDLKAIAQELGVLAPQIAAEPPRANAPDPAELPGQRQSQDPGVIRIDDEGREWLQEEVRKPAYPKPRGRRVLTYLDTGVKTETIKSGEYVETFEVAGERTGRPAEVKITLPSYQVGIYKDPRFPFKVHTYNDRSGFALADIEEYFGGAELVPRTCKRIYIENDLCYDIRSVVQTIDAQYRELILNGKVR